jgi:hypothetical protein
MMPEGNNMSPSMRKHVMDALRKKLTPGMQEGEMEGSWHDTLMMLMPDMKMDPEGMKPGKSSEKMIQAMLEGWRQKHGQMPDIEPWPMDREPSPSTHTAAN